MIEELISHHITPVSISKGWHTVRCPICNDYKNRGGFTFDDEGVIYSCFNCGTKAYHKNEWTSLNRNFKKVLKAFGVSQEEIDEVEGKLFFINAQNTDVLSKTEKEYNFNTPEIPLPPGSYPVDRIDDNDPFTLVTEEYLSLRGLSLNDHIWYLSTDEKYRFYLIIPYYRNGKIIYWQARAFDPQSKERYLNPVADRENIIFGYDQLTDYTKKTIFVTEGVFDAISINGVAILGSSLSEAKIKLFEKYKKDYVFIIDKDKTGYLLGKKAIQHGWKITFVSGESNDTNEAVSKYGKLWTINNLMENIKEGWEAELYLETLCKK